MGPIEAALIAVQFHDPRAGVTNARGDHVGHTAALGAADQAVLATAIVFHPSAAAIRAGCGTQLIAAFTRWAGLHGVRVIGGLATGFADAPVPAASLQAIRSVYVSNGGEFLELPKLSRYPRSAFFDSVEHLNEAWQVEHSTLLAEWLRWLRVPIAATRPADPTDPPAPHNTSTD